MRSILSFIVIAGVFGPALTSIKCATTEWGVFAECYSNWCRTFINPEGRIEKGCDIGGDCERIQGHRSFYHPDGYQNSCRTINGRTFCCCNFNNCNSNSAPASTVIFSIFCLVSIFFLF